MKAKDFIIKGCSKLYKKFTNKKYYDHHPNCVFNRQAANDIIYDTLKSGKPIMLTRYGSIEIGVANTYRIQHVDRTFLCKCIDYIKDKTDMPWMDENFPLFMSRNAGVFNPSREILERFAQRYLEDSKIVDILMSVNYKEKFMPLPDACQYIHFESVYPFFVERPWTRIFKGKKVLVVHPFDKSITKQYAIREKLFENSEILPEFELKTLKAVQSSAYSEVPFKDWFEALKYMEDEISKIDFDICLLGCGAYGLPLAAHVKRLGKQAIHLGGGVQLLFGIKGQRWEGEYEWTYNTTEKLNMNYRDLFNEHWIRPSADETPKSAKEVEGACYW